MTLPHNTQIEDISGTVERITYHNEENGFCVLRVNVQGYKEFVTILGNAPLISVGEYIRCSGQWHNDKNHGRQFKADFLKAQPPNSLAGIEKYLASGLIKGIGIHFAKKIVKTFGEEIFNVIENTPLRLLEIPNMGQARVDSICESWQEQKSVRDIMIFLQSHGIGTHRATRIYKTYKEQAMNVVMQNPYQLAYDIRGLGFLSVDKIALNIGITKDSSIRARAGITHVLLEATSEGHCGLPVELLIEKTEKLLGVDANLIEESIDLEIGIGVLSQDTLTIPNNILVDMIFLNSYYIYEKHSCKMLFDLSQTKVPWENVDVPISTSWAEQQLNIKLADTQKLAIKEALEQKVMVITGGPGTGKTTLVKSILTILNNQNLNIKLCAPTGRAARRLSESTGLEATTIHRMLEVDFVHGKGFKKNKNNKLEADYIVVDEVSMVDIKLFYFLLEAIPSHAALLLVGDVDQLPSIGSGQVLKDIIDSNTFKVIKLTEIFRQAAMSEIIINAHLINQGKMPNLSSSKSSTNLQDTNTLQDNHIKAESEKDFYFIGAEQGDDLIKKLIELVTNRIPKRFGFHPVRDLQILTPMQLGTMGARNLNIELQKVLNPNYETGITKFGQYFATGDKIMQTENDYSKEVYNGDIGQIESINNEEQEMTINFYGRLVIYDFSDLDHITLAYATTIHKSQGSEYPVVIIPITTQSSRMLRPNLIYTAITRGKSLVILLGSKQAIYTAVNNLKSTFRYSKLREWLEQIHKDAMLLPETE